MQSSSQQLKGNKFSLYLIQISATCNRAKSRIGLKWILKINEDGALSFCIHSGQEIIIFKNKKTIMGDFLLIFH